MLLACRLLGFDPRSYDAPDHPLQIRIREKIAFYSLFPDDRIEIGVDGCSLPVFRLPISRLAAAYARLLEEGALSGESPVACSTRRTIVGAMTGSPFFVSGSGQFTTCFLEAGRGRWLGKEGAEGVYAIGLSRPGRGVAFKIDDGGARSRHAVAMELMRQLGEMTGGPAETLAGFARPRIRNARGAEVGEIIVSVALEHRA
jgi:L-asparaginase II